jgi:DNA-binding transcriptional ArsR family regulator
MLCVLLIFTALTPSCSSFCHGGAVKLGLRDIDLLIDRISFSNRKNCGKRRPLRRGDQYDWSSPKLFTPTPRRDRLAAAAQSLGRTETSFSVDHRIAKALSHPLRAEILTILHKRVASPNQLSQELGEGLSQVSYHVKVLKDFDCIELVKTEPRRGAVEHFYRAIAAPFLSDEDFGALPTSARQDLTLVSMQMINRDVVEAVGAGTFNSREDRHFSRTALVIDEQGWKDLAFILEDALDRVLAVQTESSLRLAKSQGEEIHTKVDILHFESPAPGHKDKGE